MYNYNIKGNYEHNCVALLGLLERSEDVSGWTQSTEHVLAITVKKEQCILSSGFSGPWFIGEVIEGHNGACFAFGVFVDGHFLEGSLTYVVGVTQVIQDLGSDYTDRNSRVVTCCLSSTGALLQYASHLLPLLESSPQVSRKQLPHAFLSAGQPLEDSADARRHAGPHDLAGLFLLLSAGDLRTAGLLPLSRTYLGPVHGSAVGVQGMVGNTS